MTKLIFLRLLARSDKPDAHQIALTLGVSYPAAAMALLRLVRQGLAARYRDPESDLYWYELTAKGEVRLDFLDTSRWENDDA